METIEEATSAPVELLAARFDPLVEGKAGAQLDFELCVMLLDTHPSEHYKHLEHLLKFESGRVSSTHVSIAGDGEGPKDDSSEPRLSPYNLPNPIIDRILSGLASQEISSLSLTSPDWKHHIKNDFLSTMEAEWPVATRSRRILSELASAFGGAIISPVYDWKQLYRYLESIKSEVDVSIALHEQLLSLTALAHFILITDDMGDSYHSYLRQTTEWISRLVEEWATVFVQDVYRTHVTPIFSDYLGTKSAEDALETLILLAESFTKVRHFTSVLLAAIAPLNDLLSLESLKHLSCINIKPALTEALKALPVDFKTALFELTFACDALRSDHAQHLYPLEDYFQLIEEPALATFMPKEEGRTFKVLRQACVRLCDESRVFLRINHLERFESLSLDLEHAMRIGSRLHLDDTLDLELTLPKLIFRSDLDRLLEFSEILDETTTFDAENQQEARLAFVRKFLENPRDLAVLLLSAREVGLKPLQEALETTIKLMNSTKSSTEDHGDV